MTYDQIVEARKLRREHATCMEIAHELGVTCEDVEDALFGGRRQGRFAGPMHEPVFDPRAQDARYVAAMQAAIERGLERPPMVGVDTRPCTLRPVFVHLPGRGSSGSPGAQCVDE